MRRAARSAHPEACAGALPWSPRATFGSPSRGGCAAPSDPRSRRLLPASTASGEPQQQRQRIERRPRRALATAQLQVELVAPTRPRAANRAHALAAPDANADPRSRRVQHVQIDERAAHSAIPDRDVVAAPAVVSGLDDAAVAHRDERGAGRSEHVLALVDVPAAPGAEAGVLLAEVDPSANREYRRRLGWVPE